MLGALLVGAALAAAAPDPPPTLARRPTPAIAPRSLAPPPGDGRWVARRRDDPPTDDAPDAWLGADKVKHFLMVGFVESVSYGLARAAGASGNGALVVGVGVGAAASVGKEVYDRRGGRAFSVRDLVWDAAGLLAHGALLAQVDG